GAAAVGSAFSPVNPFQVVIAQRLADVPLFSGAAFRMAVFAPALALWIGGTMRHARATGTKADRTTDVADQPLDHRSAVILSLVGATFAVFIVGMLRFGWGFNEMSALFFVLGVVAGLVGRLGINGTAAAYVQGFREMA